MSIKCYSELILLPTFEERYRYLKLEGIVGKETFGFDRYMNLGIAGREIFHRPIIHHMNPIRPEDIRDRLEMILDPEYLITTIHETHQAIHYGDENLLFRDPVDRRPNDTCPWKK